MVVLKGVSINNTSKWLQSFPLLQLQNHIHFWNNFVISPTNYAQLRISTSALDRRPNKSLQFAMKRWKMRCSWLSDICHATTHDSLETVHENRHQCWDRLMQNTNIHKTIYNVCWWQQICSESKSYLKYIIFSESFFFFQFLINERFKYLSLKQQHVHIFIQLTPIQLDLNWTTIHTIFIFFHKCFLY